MKIFIESVDPGEIRMAVASGLADGIAFSQIALRDEDAEEQSADRLGQIAREFALPVCVAVGSVSSGDMYREARDLAKLSDHIVVELPLIEDALEPMHRLDSEGISVCAAFVFNAAQALLAAKAGASLIRVLLDELDAHGQSGTATLAEIKTILEASGEECDVMVGSTGTAARFSDAVVSGADVICVKPDMLRSLLTHPLTDRGVDRFLSDLSRRPRARS
jgi:Transaldolase